MAETITRQATETHAVMVTASPRTFPRRSIDYTVTVVDREGAVSATVVCGSEVAARELANAAWIALRAGVAPANVWNAVADA